MNHILIPAVFIACAIAGSAQAQDTMPAMDHGGQVFNMIKGEFDYADDHGGLINWDIDGWIGGDRERVWLRSEGEIEDGRTQTAEAQLYYGWNVDMFWDALVGARQDFEPDSKTYLAASLVGLAPYFFETEASVFLADDGGVSARFKQSFDLLITQQWIVEPHLELNAYAQDVPERGVGAGLSDVELGVQMRYEITRQFAPYVDLVWDRQLGETASIARAAGEDVDNTTLRVGLRVWF
jgi:copper resistance protein B